MRLLGQSRRSEGLVYADFSKKHIIVDPFEVPRDWTRYCAIDPGWRTCAVLWAAVAPSSHYVLYRELYYHGKRWDEVLEQILISEGYVKNPLDEKLWMALEGRTETIKHRWIDPSAFGHTTAGELGWGILMAQTSHRMGLGSRMIAAPARNDVIPGIDAVRRDLECGLDGTPRLRVLANLKNFVAEVRNYRWKQNSGGPRQQDPKDAPNKKNDHLVDCLRYLVNGGLQHAQPPDPYLTGNREDLLFQGAATSMDDRWREHWRSIYEKQRDGAEATPVHHSGIGSEY
jgi:phage terminase large subunit